VRHRLRLPMWHFRPFQIFVEKDCPERHRGMISVLREVHVHLSAADTRCTDLENRFVGKLIV
jgi:hypothetical protein